MADILFLLWIYCIFGYVQIMTYSDNDMLIVQYMKMIYGKKG